MFDELLEANAAYAASFAGGHLARRPVKQLVVITCMDARIDPLALLGLTPGDAHVLRNAGGRISDDVIRSLVVSTRLLGTTRVVVMHHTGCGMATITRRDVRAILGDIAEHHWESFQLLEISHQEEALREDVAAVRESPLLPALEVAGFLYDVKTGRARRLL